VLTPDENEPGGHRIALHELAGILTLASDSKKASLASEKDLSQIKLVAGARNHLDLQLSALTCSKVANPH